MKTPVQLPSTLPALLSAFRDFLSSRGLGVVSRKLYTADLARFLASSRPNPYALSTLADPKTYAQYLAQPGFLASSTLLRRTLTSLRQFGLFLNETYSLPNPAQNLTLTPTPANLSLSRHSQKYIKECLEYLKANHLSATSLKSYKSDITQYLTYLETHHPSTNIASLLNEKNLQIYIDLLTHLQTQSPATITRKTKTIRRFLNWFTSTQPRVVISDNHDFPASTPRLEPLSPASPTPSAFTAARQLASPLITPPSPDSQHNIVKNLNYRIRPRLPSFRSFLTLLILLLFASTLSILAYRQFGTDTQLTAAFPTTPVTPNRQLSFQGRLENASGTPITSATNFVFKLFDASSGGSELYSSGTCSITPDADGVFSTQIGSTCGSGIGSSVFTENADIWLEVTVAAETLTPRQQIATVAYALNSETIQGFPISATVSALRNTVVPMNQWGEIIVGEQSPRLTGVAGTFQISAPSLSLVTATGTNGNITLAPDGTGQINFQGNTTSTNFFNVSNAQLTTGSLMTGTVANNNTGFKLLDLLSGSSPTSKFSVDHAGNTILATGADLFIGTIGLNDVGSSNTTSGASLIGTYDEFDNSASTTLQDVLDDLDAAITTGIAGAGDITAVGSMTSGATFADSTADDDWLGLGASAGRIEFDDQTTDEINFLNANVGIGTSTPQAGLDVASGRIRVTSNAMTPTTGTGIELFHDGTTGDLLSYNRTGGAYTALRLRGSTIQVYGSNGTAGIDINATGNVGIGDTTPAYLFTVGNGDLFQVNSSGNAKAPTLSLGTNTIAPTDRLFGANTSTALTNASTYTGTFSRTLTGTLTGNIANSIGLYNNLVVNATDGVYSHHAMGTNNLTSLSNGNTIDTLRGIYNIAQNNSTTLSPDTGATATTSAGITSIAVNSAAGIITNQYGGDFTSYNNSTGSVTNARGILSSAYNNNATGTIGTAYGGHNQAYTNVNGASITTAYGTYGSVNELAAQTTGGITTGYGGYFISQDATTSYGLYAKAIQNTANTETFTNAYGIRNDCESNGTNVTITNCYGIQSTITETLGTITNGFSGYFSSAAAMGTGYGVYSNLTGASPTSYGLFSNVTGAGTTNYGLYTNVSGAGTNYAIYTNGSARSFLGGNLGIAASGYLNFGTTDGTSGYGFRDNAGTIEFKNSAGAWAAIGSGGGGWTDAGTYLYPTSGEVLGNSAAAGANKLAGIYLADSSPLTFGTDNDFSFSFNNTTSTLGSTLTSGTRLGINTISALATLDLRSSLGTIPTASISGNTSMSSLIVDQSGSGDIFTASSSGQTRFVVKNNGNVGIGSTGPDAKLDVLATSGEQLRLTYTDGSVYTGFTVNSGGDLTIDATGGDINLSDNLNFAGGTTYYVNNSGDAVFRDLQVLDSANPGLTVGSGTTGYVKIGSSTIYDGNATYLSFDPDSDTVDEFRINNDGSITFQPITSSALTTEGTTYYDTDNDHLYLMDGSSVWHRIALDMTKYASNSANIVNQNYIEIAHNQNTNDLSLTGWFYDTTTSLWTNIKDRIGSFLHNLDNQFNPVYAQKYKASTVALDYSINDLGTGADGAITVNSNRSINTNDSITGRTCDDSGEGGDAVNYSVTALTANTATLESSPAGACLAVGDEVLLINLRGNSTSFVNVGNFETLRIQSIAANVVTFTTSKTKYYGDGAGDDTNIGVGTSAQAVMLQRVPNYTTVTVDASYSFYPDDWVQPTGAVNNGAGEGGVMFFRATGAVTINGTIHATGKGYIAGAGSGSDATSTTGGEAYCGTNNTAGGAGGNYTSRNGGAGSCGGGGGAGTYVGVGAGTGGSGSSTRGGAGGGGGSGYYYYGGGGGGGGYGGAGAGGGGANAGASGSTNASGNGGSSSNSQDQIGGGGGGGTYGDANLNDLMFGSSGGGGGGYDGSNVGAAGGDGGGIVYIAGGSVTVNGTLAANGNAGSSGTGTYGSGGGGGAGGSVKVIGTTVALGSPEYKTTALGGSGGGNGRGGGAGGAGRVAVGAATTPTNQSNPNYTPLTVGYNTYAVFVSEEIFTPGATSFGNLAWTESLPSGTNVQFQTRSGSTADSTDGTWETWKPSTVTTNYVDLNNMDTPSDWTATNLPTKTDGDITRNVDYYEDEDEFDVGDTLKIGSVGSANGYVEDTITAVDLTGFDYISAWVYATASGNVVKLGFGESAATEQEETVTIDAMNTWQKVYWPLNDLTSGSCTGGDGCNQVDLLRISVTRTNTTVYIDSLKAEKALITTSSGSSIASTANNYLQYRAILTTTNTSNQSSFSSVTAGYTNSSGTYTIDANRIRTNNDVNYYSSDRLIVTETALNNNKSIHTSIAQTSVSSTTALDKGTGADGAITVNSNRSINTNDSITGRTCDDSGEGGDAVNYSVTALTANTATLESSPAGACLAVGDEVLLINLRGNSTSFVNVGNFETLRIQSIAANVVTFTTSKTKYYGDGAGDDTNIGVGTSAQAVMLQRVPNYTTVTVDASYSFYPDDWVQPTGAVNNGAGEGGVMFFRATGAVTINGTIHATGKGYIAGAGSGSDATSTTGGEAYCGTNNTAGGAGGNYTSRNGGAGSCGGGGGAGTYVGVGAGTGGSGSSTRGGAGGGGGSGYYYYGGGGGGGGYGGAGAGGGGANAGASGSTNASGNGGSSSNSQDQIGGGGGGGTYGDANLNDLMFGSSGGGGGGYDGSNVGAAGGDGGGIVYIAGGSVTVNGTLAANGNAGSSGTGTYGSGGGGGAGGSVKVIGTTVALGSPEYKTTALGGSGGGNGRGGGAGGAGRVAVGAATTPTNQSNPNYTPLTVGYNTYAVFVSDEIPTPNATELNKLTYTFDQNSYGMVQFQTRSGKSNNATDGSWEAWKPAVSDSNIKTLNAMDATSDWTVTNLNAAADGALARNVDEFEDEDITNAANKSVKFGSVGSAAGYAEDTISSTDLSNYDLVSAWVYATASGSLVKIGFGESAATEQEETFTIDTANTWQKVYWDITDVDESLRNAVTKLRISLLSTNTTVYIDSLQAERLMNNPSGHTITSTPNDFLQYRAILTTTNISFQPKLFNVKAEWNNGFKIVQTDANTVRLYNYTGDTQQIRLDAIVFGADLAEWYTVNDQAIGPGDLVALTGELDDYGVPILRKSEGVNDPQLVGAISTKAGKELGLETPDRRLLGLAGRIPVKVDPDSPPIKAGDALTASNIPGKATLAIPGEKTIGTATTDWTPSQNQDTVLMLINNSTAPSPTTLSSNLFRYVYGTRSLISETTGRAVTQNGIFANILTPQIKTQLISPLASDSALIITGPVAIKPDPSSSPDLPALLVDGEIEATTISARLAELEKIEAETLTARDIVADTITANTIIGLDSKIASLSAISDDDIQSITDRIKARLSDLTNPVSATDLPAPESNSNLAPSLATDPTPFIASSAATLATADINFATINEYLAVIGTASITTLNVNAGLYTDTINSQTGTLALQPAGGLINLAAGTLLVDSSGSVAINGDLYVNGRILADSASLNTLSLGNAPTATNSSALGNLLAIYNEEGQTVATIDASGSANLASLTTNMITIASASTATDSSALAALTGNAESNATAGTATLTTPNTELIISSPYVTPNSLVYLTPTTNTDNKVLFVKSKDTSSFTVAIDNPASSDISFNWWIIQLAN